MKIGICADIHGNSEAFRAVLDAFDSQRIDRIFCVGDVIGYGGSPVECIELLQERHAEVVRGNHDDYAVRDEKHWRIHASATEALRWTRSVLSTAHKDWLKSLPYQLTYRSFSFVHASHTR